MSIDFHTLLGYYTTAFYFNNYMSDEDNPWNVLISLISEDGSHPNLVQVYEILKNQTNLAIIRHWHTREFSENLFMKLLLEEEAFRILSTNHPNFNPRQWSNLMYIIERSYKNSGPDLIPRRVRL
jgi:hypothetical protein